MKLGQWLSMRPDLFPPDVIEALSRLRNDAPSHTYEHTRATIRQASPSPAFPAIMFCLPRPAPPAIQLPSFMFLRQTRPGAVFWCGNRAAF
jgi:hypothetical protein